MPRARLRAVEEGRRALVHARVQQRRVRLRRRRLPGRVIAAPATARPPAPPHPTHPHVTGGRHRGSLLAAAAAAAQRIAEAALAQLLRRRPRRRHADAQPGAPAPAHLHLTSTLLCAPCLLPDTPQVIHEAAMSRVFGVVPDSGALDPRTSRASSKAATGCYSCLRAPHVCRYRIARTPRGATPPLRRCPWGYS